MLAYRCSSANMMAFVSGKASTATLQWTDATTTLPSKGGPASWQTAINTVRWQVKGGQVIVSILRLSTTLGCHASKTLKIAQEITPVVV